jgi:hypothetical protein
MAGAVDWDAERELTALDCSSEVEEVIEVLAGQVSGQEFASEPADRHLEPAELRLEIDCCACLRRTSFRFREPWPFNCHNPRVVGDAWGAAVDRASARPGPDSVWPRARCRPRRRPAVQAWGPARHVHEIRYFNMPHAGLYPSRPRCVRWNPKPRLVTA